MNTRLVFIAVAMLVTIGCSTFTTPRYSISANNHVALKSMNLSRVGIGSFSGPRHFDNYCRGAGPLAPIDGLSYADYIKQAFESELKVAGAYDDKSPNVILSGEIIELGFSSSSSVTRGSWHIDLMLRSSNGESIRASETYQFESGFLADTACKQTAEAFEPAVQDLIGKTISNPGFITLLK